MISTALTALAAVTAVDISATQVALAAKNVPAANVLCADMMALDYPQAAFDAVCAFYAITHLPREEHGELFRRVAHWLKPGGYFLASLGAGAADGEDSNWLGAPNYFSHYDAATNLKLLTEAGFVIIEHETVSQDLKGEEDLRFLWIVARKP